MFSSGFSPGLSVSSGPYESPWCHEQHELFSALPLLNLLSPEQNLFWPLWLSLPGMSPSPSLVV